MSLFDISVYDGHGGSKVATHVSRNLHRIILRRPEYKEGRYEDAIIAGYLECDQKMRTEESLKDEMSGSTAVTALLRYYRFCNRNLTPTSYEQF